MKRFGAALVVGTACLALAACGGDNTTTFVLDTGTPSASASAKAGASGSAKPSATPVTSTLPVTAPTPIADPSLKIIIDSPDAGTTISSPVQLSGTASVDKGTVVAVVLDASDNELGRATTTASAARPDYGHFDVSVSFTPPPSGTKGKLKVFGVGRDGTTPTYYYFITIRFA